MEEQRIKLETAQLVKEKGFAVPTEYVYLENEHGYMYLDQRDWYLSDHWEDQYLSMDKVFPAPTQSLLQAWLRKQHNINVFPRYSGKIDVYFYWLINGKEEIEMPSHGYDTYEEALEKGLIEALKLI